MDPLGAYLNLTHPSKNYPIFRLRVPRPLHALRISSAMWASRSVMMARRRIRQRARRGSLTSAVQSFKIGCGYEPKMKAQGAPELLFIHVFFYQSNVFYGFVLQSLSKVPSKWNNLELCSTLEGEKHVQQDVQQPRITSGNGKRLDTKASHVQDVQDIGSAVAL